MTKVIILLSSFILPAPSLFLLDRARLCLYVSHLFDCVSDSSVLIEKKRKKKKKKKKETNA